MQLVAIIEDVITEIGYWIKAIAVGDNDVSSGGESGNRHFFMSIPYIRENSNHQTIPIRPMVTTSNLHELSDDELLFIFTFLDCKTLLSLSRCCTFFYHISHHDIIWSPWLQLEHTIKSNAGLISSVPSFSLIAPAVPTVNNEGEESDELATMRERFFLFYRPTREEAIYNQFRQADFEEYFAAASQSEDETTRGTLTLADDQTHEVPIEIPVVVPPNDEELFGITLTAMQQGVDPTPSLPTPVTMELHQIISARTARHRNFYHFRERETERSSSLPDIAGAAQTSVINTREVQHAQQRSSSSSTSLTLPDLTNILTLANNPDQGVGVVALEIEDSSNEIQVQYDQPNITIVPKELDDPIGLAVDEPKKRRFKEHERSSSWLEEVGKKIHQRQENRRRKIMLMHNLNDNHNYLMNQTVSQRGKQKSSKASASMNDTPPTTAYIMFRKEKIRNPFIRSRLLRTYVQGIKCRYEPITKWLNHIKALSIFALIIFAVLCVLRLDNIIDWSWFFVYLPALAFAAAFLMLNVIYWLPTLQWPLVLYRWVTKDYVGWWTSYAYCLSRRGRFVQLIFGILLAMIPVSVFFIILFPEFVPKWTPCAVLGTAFAIWTYTSTQIIYPGAKRWYPWLLFLFALMMIFFAGAMISKMLIPIFDQYLTWTIISIPLYLASIILTLYHFKLTNDLNLLSTKHCMGLLWNISYLLFCSVVVTGGLFVLLRVDNVITWPWSITLVPLYCILVLLEGYFVIRCSTTWISQAALKNPFTIVGHGGVKNSVQMDAFVV